MRKLWRNDFDFSLKPVFRSSVGHGCRDLVVFDGLGRRDHDPGPRQLGMGFPKPCNHVGKWQRFNRKSGFCSNIITGSNSPTGPCTISWSHRLTCHGKTWILTRNFTCLAWPVAARSWGNQIKSGYHWWPGNLACPPWQDMPEKEIGIERLCS